MAATPMVPDEIDRRQYAARRLRRIDARKRIQCSSDPKRAQALWDEDNPREVEFCHPDKGHRLRPVGYLRGPRPDGLDCQKPLRVVCSECDYATVWACSNHRESACRPCAGRYRRRVRALASAGMTKVGGHHYFGTFTAPSDVHRMPSGDVCPCSIEGFDLAEWNTSHSMRWNHLRTLLRREYPELQFFRGVEPQKRGALHDHVMIWSRYEISLQTLRKLAVRAGFGHEVYCPEVRPGSTQCAYYVSKYVTKACDSRSVVPWLGDVVDFDTGEVTEGLVDARYRTWSQSRDWGTTMAAVRAEAAQMARSYELRAAAPVEAQFVAAFGAQPVLDPDEIPPPTG